MGRSIAVLKRIKPIHPPLTPPRGAVAAGVTPDGKQLWTLKSKRARNVPLMENTPEADARAAELLAEGKTEKEIGRIMTEEGYRRYRKNQVTGELAYPLNKPVVYDHEELFYLESEGNGNVVKVKYRHPSAADRERAQLRERVAAMKDQMAEVMVKEGVTPEDLVAMLRQGRRPFVAPAPVDKAAVTAAFAPPPVAAGPEIEYPVALDDGRWKLSNGNVMPGTRDEAEEAELAVIEAREAAAATPEE